MNGPVTLTYTDGYASVGRTARLIPLHFWLCTVINNIYYAVYIIYGTVLERERYRINKLQSRTHIVIFSILFLGVYTRPFSLFGAGSGDETTGPDYGSRL